MYHANIAANSFVQSVVHGGWSQNLLYSTSTKAFSPLLCEPKPSSVLYLRFAKFCVWRIRSIWRKMQGKLSSVLNFLQSLGVNTIIISFQTVAVLKTAWEARKMSVPSELTVHFTSKDVTTLRTVQPALYRISEVRQDLQWFGCFHKLCSQLRRSKQSLGDWQVPVAPFYSTITWQLFLMKRRKWSSTYYKSQVDLPYYLPATCIVQKKITIVR